MAWTDQQLQSIRDKVARKYGEDAAQEAIVRALMKYDAGQESELEALTYTIAKRLQIDEARARSRQNRHTKRLKAEIVDRTEPTQLARVEALEILEALPRERVETALAKSEAQESRLRAVTVYRLRKEIRDKLAAMGLTALTMVGAVSTMDVVTRLTCGLYYTEVEPFYATMAYDFISEEEINRLKYQGWNLTEWKEALCGKT